MKFSSNIFRGNILDWTVSQRLFAYWCGFYDNIYESYERPPERIIDDDELLNIWLEKQGEKTKAYAEESWGKLGATKDIKTAWDHPEVMTFGDWD
jgi:hypothetical protein